MIYGLAWMVMVCGGLFAAGVIGRVTGEVGYMVCRWIIKKQEEERNA